MLDKEGPCRSLIKAYARLHHRQKGGQTDCKVVTTSSLGLLRPVMLGGVALTCTWVVRRPLNFTESGPPGDSSGTQIATVRPLSAVDAATVAQAWRRTAKRAAAGRAIDAPVRIAWIKTLQWVAVGLGVKVIGRRKRTPMVGTGEEGQPKAVPKIVSSLPEANPPKTVGGFTEADARGAKRALQRLELPFYATESKQVREPMFGIRVKGNLRGDALEQWEDVADKVRLPLEEELGQELIVYLLRADDAGRDNEFDLFVRQKRTPSSIAAADLTLPIIALAATVVVTLGLCSSDVVVAGASESIPFGLPRVSSVFPAAFESGIGLPSLAVCLLGGLLAISIATRVAVANILGVSMGPPVVLPSPQLGMAGVFMNPVSTVPSYGAALALAMCGPLSMAVTSIALLIYGQLVPSGMLVALRSPMDVAWPLALLPAQCDAMVWAGAQGLLMASLALLPSSPDGASALQSLLGKKAAEQVSDGFTYTYPFLSVLCAFSNSQGWLGLPFWWTFLLINFAPLKPELPLQEVSEVPLVAKAFSFIILAFAIALALPWPLHTLIAG